MLNEPQINRLLIKIENFLNKSLEPRIFEKVAELDFSAFLTGKQYHCVPDEGLFENVKPGYVWYGRDSYCWFRSSFTVPEQLAGIPLFIKPHMQGYEAMLFVNGCPSGTFATKIVYTEHGNHYCDLLKYSADAGEKIDIAIEWYGGHVMPGTGPYSDSSIKDFNFTYSGADVCVKNELIQDYYFDLLTVWQLADTLPQDSFMRGKALNALLYVNDNAFYDARYCTEEEFLEGIRKTSGALKEVLAIKASETDPEIGVIGHSHMDTAWLWHVAETEKKCARTYSNQLSLMEQYPEYKFVQSSSCHSNMILKNYPELFERIKKAVADGRYEPNGGVWVECDCNITGGESMIRQFLWGQRFTRKHFNYTSDCFWLPDTFGYSAAIPQIMKGCGVDYFLTTKIAWNDTNTFPYDTFWWQGIDGTRVLSNFNRTHAYPDAKTLYTATTGQIMQKSVTNKRLFAYGHGDGGGGPQFESIEMARRCEDLNEIGRAKTMTVSEFMKNLEATMVNPNTYRGELYLELHRGTLTNQHTIKRNNRKSEIALRNLEIISVNEAVKSGKAASAENIAPLWEDLLINQFHDILPGTCLTRAHEESRAQTTALIKKSYELIADMTGAPDGDSVSLINTLSFDRSDPILLSAPQGYIVDCDVKQQRYTDIDGNSYLYVSGVTVPAMSAVTLTLKKGEIEGKSAFEASGNSLKTPFAVVKFAENGTIESFVDLETGRELRGDGYNLNSFIMAEDVPSDWDNWDLDADIEGRFRDVSNLVSREVVSDGEAAYIIRSVYAVSEKSTITQDMIFSADSKLVRFDTCMDWQDDHRLLKTAFDTTVFNDFARFEIQYGNVKRTTTRNNSIEQAKFEVVNHKFTDVSETRFGISILNDCKYGITVEGGKMRLSLHKGGRHPDGKGDHDCPHYCSYGFLPHTGDFCAQSVIRPAYEFNMPCVIGKGGYSLKALVSVDAPNVIVETVKPCEDSENAFIARLYEAEGTSTTVTVTAADGCGKIEKTNMLEESGETLSESGSATLSLRGFEIVTLKISY